MLDSLKAQQLKLTSSIFQEGAKDLLNSILVRLAHSHKSPSPESWPSQHPHHDQGTQCLCGPTALPQEITQCLRHGRYSVMFLEWIQDQVKPFRSYCLHNPIAKQFCSLESICFADDLGLESPRGQALIFSLLSSPTGSILFVEMSRIHKPSYALSNTHLFNVKTKHYRDHSSLTLSVISKRTEVDYIQREIKKNT